MRTDVESKKKTWELPVHLCCTIHEEGKKFSGAEESVPHLTHHTLGTPAEMHQ